MWLEAGKLFVQMEEKRCLPDSISFKIMIQGLLREKEAHKAVQLLDEMRKRNLLQLAVEDEQ